MGRIGLKINDLHAAPSLCVRGYFFIAKRSFFRDRGSQSKCTDLEGVQAGFETDAAVYDEQVDGTAMIQEMFAFAEGERVIGTVH